MEFIRFTTVVQSIPGIKGGLHTRQYTLLGYASDPGSGLLKRHNDALFKTKTRYPPPIPIPL
jgi:hypothetical protein